MKPKRLFVAFASLIAALPTGFAQSTVTTERTVGAPVTTVETRTYVNADGKTVTERVTTSVQAERSAESKTFTAALFVTNRAGAKFDSKVADLEDFLSSSLPDLGLNLISPDLVTSSLNSFAPGASSASSDSSSAAEAALGDQSSALRLAQNLGADYILQASITSFSKKKRNIDAYGVKLTNYDYTLRVSYKVLDAGNGGSLTGGVVTATQEEQNTANSNVGFNVVPPDPSTPAAPPGSEAANADEALMRFAKQYEKAIGLVWELDRNGNPQSRATAWGIGPNTFATNSHVTEPARKALAAGGQVLVIINKHPDLVYKVTKAISHPRYDENRRGYDVGILQVDGKLQSWFPVASSAELQRLDSGYRVAYLGFPASENTTAADPRSPVATMQSGIITSVTDFAGGIGTPESRQLVQHNLSSSGGASGSPVFNSKGQVVALHNSGNARTGIVLDANDNMIKKDLKSGLQISYAQRADLLADIYKYSGSGSSSDAGSSAASSAKPANPAFLEPDLEPVVNDLLADVAQQITSALKSKIAQNRIRPATKSATIANVTIDVETADLYIPDIRVGPEKTVSIQDGKLRVAPLDVSVEVDGITVGSAPGTIKLKPGISHLRLTRTGYEPWERTINAADGQTLKVALRMNEEGLARWKELTVFLFSLQNGAKLTDAQVELIRGQAAAFAKSGFKVDIKVDTQEPITIDNSKTIVK